MDRESEKIDFIIEDGVLIRDSAFYMDHILSDRSRLFHVSVPDLMFEGCNDLILTIKM